MPHCQKCDEDFDGQLTSCPKCGLDFEDENDNKDWILIARVSDKISADFVKETLNSNDIPNTVISESGFFGLAGLNLPSLTGKGFGKFQIHIQKEYRDEAEEILKLTLGDKWEKAEN